MSVVQNNNNNQSSRWIKLWIGAGLFCGIAGFVFDIIQFSGVKYSTTESSMIAPVLTVGLFAAFFVVRSLVLKRDRIRTAVIFVGVCSVGFGFIHFIDATDKPVQGVAQTQAPL